MKVQETPLVGVKVVEPVTYRDNRGSVRERYSFRRYADAGMAEVFVQDNHTRSMGDTLRGLHYQRKHPQAKLVEATVGAIWDVAVDLRKSSRTFGRWFGLTLDAESGRQLYMPAGFAHGYCVLTEEAEIQYKLSGYYVPDDQLGIRWNDPELGIQWPIEAGVISDRDGGLPLWQQLSDDAFFP